MTTRVVQISDTHLSHVRAYGQANYDAVVRWLNDDPPELVIHTGDIVADDPFDDDERAHAVEQLRRIHAPLVVIPGNHDVGDFDGPERVANRSLTAFRSAWGHDRFAVDVEHWRLIGLNVFLLGSRSADEADQIEWLHAQTADANLVALFLHEPLTPLAIGSGWTLPPEANLALLGALAGVEPRFVASGHLHRYRTAVAPDGTATIWCPATSLLGRDWCDGSLRSVGVVEYRFDGDTVSYGFVRPPGMVDVEFEALAPGGRGLRDAPLFPMPGHNIG